MNGVLYLAVVVAAFGSGLAQQTRPPPDPCRTCQILINIAYHHFNNTVNDKPGLLTQLQLECQKLAQYEGAQASADCTRIVNANIDTIYNDLNAQKSPQQTCMDIKECPAPMGGAPVLKRQKRQQPHTACNTCQIIIGVAKRHFNNNITDVNALKAQLDMECQALTQHGYTQTEADNCQSLVDANMNAIFMELQNNPTASPQKICQDLGQCTMLRMGAEGRWVPGTYTPPIV
uniref:Saposin B-type domain-containing protein n=1 Tax=Plectus sambesii TaxID=2011161 RepID=A0A914WIH4_9BILA